MNKSGVYSHRPSTFLPFYLLLVLLGLSFLACDFRDPDEGFDSNWSPDQQEGSSGDQDDATGSLPPEGSGFGTGSEGDEAAISTLRPLDVVADTAGSPTKSGEWKNEQGDASIWTAYMKGKEPMMIVETIPEGTRTYYFNNGSFFYFTELSEDGQSSLVVEFDDFGDVRGAQKIVGGEDVRGDRDDYSFIVKHMSELLLEVRGT